MAVEKRVKHSRELLRGDLTLPRTKEGTALDAEIQEARECQSSILVYEPNLLFLKPIIEFLRVTKLR
jgi:hypothetical protein